LVLLLAVVVVVLVIVAIVAAATLTPWPLEVAVLLLLALLVAIAVGLGSGDAFLAVVAGALPAIGVFTLKTISETTDELTAARRRARPRRGRAGIEGETDRLAA
jgi:hypothetical protein